MRRPLASLSLNLDQPLMQAAFPLLEAGEVEAIEWSFDALHRYDSLPDWFSELLQQFGQAGRLIGHGIYFSIFRAQWSPEQEKWLDDLGQQVSAFQFDHISEHFGFLTGEHFHKGAPLSVPCTPEMLAIGQDRLLRLAQASQCPVGLENLAFAWHVDAVREHGKFLEQLLAPVDGFIILDLHNLYCQIHNFGLEFAELIQLYPLDRVREIHISGGSWDAAGTDNSQAVRRDTHDDGVPDEVFQLLEQTLHLCANVKFVVLEQMGISLHSAESQARYRADFRTMARIIAVSVPQNGPERSFMAKQLPAPGLPPSDSALYAQQIALSAILETAADAQQARKALLASPLAGSAWQAQNWPTPMLETAVQIARKWKQGFH